MKPYIRIYLLLSCLAGSLLSTVSPAFAQDTGLLPFGYAYKAIVKIYTYESGNFAFLNRKSAGSGIILDNKGTILTNYHVIADEEKSATPRNTSYQICLTENLEIAPKCEYAAQLVAADKKNDVALLRIVPQEKLRNVSEFPYVELETGSPIQVGRFAAAFGYPSVGGETITISRGEILGKEIISGQAWLKTDALFSFGSSGGALLNIDGKVIGITTAGKKDLISLGYVIDTVSIKDWVGQNIDEPVIESDIFERLVKLIEGQKFSMNYISLENLGIMFSTPDDWKIFYDDEAHYHFENPNDRDGGAVRLVVMPAPYTLDSKSLETHIKLSDPLLQLKQKKRTTLNTTKAFLLTLLSGEELSQIYAIPTKQYVIAVYYGYGKEDKDAAIVKKLIKSIKVKDHSRTDRSSPVVSNTLFSINPAKNKDWIIIPSNKEGTSLVIFNKNLPFAGGSVEVINLKDVSAFKGLTSKNFLKKIDKAIQKLNEMQDTPGLKNIKFKPSKEYKINGSSFVNIQYTTILNDELFYGSNYLIVKDNKLLQFAAFSFHKDPELFEQADRSFAKMLQETLTLKP